MPVELLYAERFLADDEFAIEYAKKTIGDILQKPVDEAVFLLGKRIIKINTMLSLDGLHVCITGKSGGGRQIGVSVMDAFKTSFENEVYIKKLEAFEKKKKKNANIVWSEAYDGITVEKNLGLYDHYIEKLQQAPYKNRPSNPAATLCAGRTDSRRSIQAHRRSYCYRSRACLVG